MWQYQNTDELYHHGVLGMKWGIRRYQNADGSLNAKGEKRYGKKANEKMHKHFMKQINRSKNYVNRKNVENRIDKEVEKSKEFKAYNNLIKKRGVVVTDKKGNVISRNLSYLKDDWSKPDKVINQMIKDKKIEDSFVKKKVAIGKKYFDEYRGALLKDLGYEDTKRGRQYLKKINF